MVEARPSGVAIPSRPRWLFGDCAFDEANWSLTVGGQPIRIERKPLEVLRALLLRAGDVVTKDELLDSIWGDVTVVEASLPTAIRKLRIAIGDGRDGRRFIETVPTVGYRFAAPVDRSRPSPETAPIAASVPPMRRRGLLTAGTALIFIAAVVAWRLAWATPAGHVYSEGEVKNALRSLDVATINQMIADGWDAKKTFKDQGGDALTYVLEICEWNPEHNRQKMQVMARTLIEAGIPVDRRNVWGDTAYSIAKAPRYCGPNHPVTEMIERICGSGMTPLGDRCMASYELARGEHFPTALAIE